MSRVWPFDLCHTPGGGATTVKLDEGDQVIEWRLQDSSLTSVKLWRLRGCHSLVVFMSGHAASCNIISHLRFLSKFSAHRSSVILPAGTGLHLKMAMVRCFLIENAVALSLLPSLHCSSSTFPHQGWVSWDSQSCWVFSFYKKILEVIIDCYPSHLNHIIHSNHSINVDIDTLTSLSHHHHRQHD